MARHKEQFWLTRRMRVSAERRIQPLRWRPPTDIYRTGYGWMVKFELAGVEEEAVQVLLQGHWLRLSGSRVDLECSKGAEPHTLEITYSHFERTVELPIEAEGARLETEYRCGMFLVHIIEEGTTS
ncbi:Hsp20/alpha crystallin family protein [Thiohalomonas denitrificans]|uniref:Hsp20/alpha crystallin family protein n=1 Tax=Thiohalomonas denitrificans TaxID=415747 RepID=A0A1G5PU88_9GAMM|nr:Hsp20/alpha crystallin family protein [Thiohalomonas denitrificans]SCZ52771.1 Hsp20/alpha crystallin family protein [Thiohalomonas denitrificans]